ncbi:MAG: DUF4301 family protein [Bacteroidales bacterium]|nr:DUF4301 family protein [Bacteroidales bacterium]
MIKSQIERFRTGYPWLDIVAAATPGRGIEVLDEDRRKEAVEYADKAQVKGKVKFVPASGAASRMFKDIFAGMDVPNDAVRRLVENITAFAFYDAEVFAPGVNVARRLLTDEGLAYGSKPKGVLKFHRYDDEVRTALAEHLVEGQEYMRNPDGSVNLVVTISPEHRQLFEDALAEVRDRFEKRYGVRYNVRFTYQDSGTDTVAVDMDNKPFLKEDGTILFRPAGHGALIYNLNDIEEELVSIKNIDNVCVQKMHPETAYWKKVLMGRALQLRDRIFGYLSALDQIEACQINNIQPVIPGYSPLQEDVYATEESQTLCNEIEEFLHEELCIEMPASRSCRERAEKIREVLSRPIRVCGMVKNTGEPGGGPYIIRRKDGFTSLQILEGPQINRDDPKALAAMKSATHFNPVDIVCCLHRYDGSKFDLLEYVDEETGFISSKSYQGRELKALELPGLWNGAMSDWNTLFVEVPVETFNPVKVVLDLLRAPHQGR